jgi:ribosome biogenesis GTPase
VVVADADGERNCFLGGHRAVVGDRVRWADARGEGGKITSVADRDTVLARSDSRGDEQILAANLRGLLVTASAQDPQFHGGLVDRYLVAARLAGLDAVIVLTKIDRGLPADGAAELAAREALGVHVLRVSNKDGTGIEAVLAFLAAESAGPWALVGYSGVGKTSLIQSLLPGQDVGPIGEISEFWGTGKHTTSRTRLFALPGGGEIVDSPGIRSFTPSELDPQTMRDHYPGIGDLRCKYRDCLHKPGEEGCVAEAEVDPNLLSGWRRLLADMRDRRGR